ncbi:metal-dependent hydrolase [compost metagenome]
MEIQYLKPNVVIEPLVNRWYAWSHLISPLTACLNIANKQINIMESYIDSPEAHQAAAKNIKLLGGPFMDYEEDKTKEIKKLKDETLSISGDYIQLSRALKSLQRMLAECAVGQSLDSLYPKIPDPLKGYVELAYDLSNQPTFRIYEPLLYKSKYYHKKSQSIALWLTENDERPFVFSTPKLDNDNVIHLSITFDSYLIDELSKMKTVPGNVENMADLLDIKPSQMALFKSFFHADPPPKYVSYTGDKVRMRYFGHACILVETEKTSILVDPLISYYGYESTTSRFSDIDLPDKIDYVLITHNHQDHLLFETLLPLRHKVKNVVVPKSNGRLQDPNLKLMLNAIGFNNVLEIGEIESVDFSDGRILGLPFLGEHADLDIQSKLCYHVKFGKFSVLFAADSRVFEPAVYKHIHRIIGDIDVIFLGMECDGAPLSWVYGPLLSESLAWEKDQSRRLNGSNCDNGLSLVDIFNPSEVYVYAMGMEPWLKFISSIKYDEFSNPIIESSQLITTCTDKGIFAERLYGEKELFHTK